MTIKDVEERTGLSRSNVRFYEKEKLVEPSRNESNGYRDYSENDVENIKKIAYLRTLGISIEDIRSIISGKVTLQETLEKQNEVLKSQITDLNKAKLMCEKMLDEESISYEKLQVEQYVTELQDYWKDNQTVFKLDSVSFLYIWGSMLTWTMITALCLIIGALSYSKLPVEIPVQWSKGVATSLVNKNWIFICPVICIIIRYLLKPFIYAKLTSKEIHEYLNRHSIPFSRSTTCLGTRLPTNTRMTRENIKQISDSEDYIYKKTECEIVKVRNNNGLALCEVDNLNKISNENTLKEINAKLKSIGFKKVALNLSKIDDDESIAVDYSEGSFEYQLPYTINIENTKNQLKDKVISSDSKKIAVKNQIIYENGLIKGNNFQSEEECLNKFMELLPDIRRNV